MAGGRLFVGSQNGTVYALDAKSGCIIWTFTAQSGVRTAPVFGARTDGPGYSVYFGDTGANVYALDAETGTPALDPARARSSVRAGHRHADARRRAAVRADLLARRNGREPARLRVLHVPRQRRRTQPATGEVIWQTYFVPPAAVVGKNDAGTPLWAPSGVAVWSSPTVDAKRQVLYVTTGNTYSGTAAEPTTDAIMALDPKTGARKWSKQLTSGDVFGCKAGAANCLEKAGPGLRLRHAGGARHHARGSRPHPARAEVGDGLRGRSRSRG